MPAKYQELDRDYAAGARRVIKTANNSMVLFSGGSKLSDDDLMHKARTVLESGATGLIFGRNMWQRPYDEALEMTGQIKELLGQFPS
jgi:class I fructose-bisphosphate aldolase